MIRDIQALPVWASVLAYTVLALGLVFVTGFILRYVVKLPWSDSEEGRHLVAMSANIGAFFVVYLLLAIWPELPGRSAIRIGLLFLLVGNCGWRWWLLEKYLREHKRV
jgi:predicted permease